MGNVEWIVLAIGGLAAAYWVEDKLSEITDRLRRIEDLLEAQQADQLAAED